MSALDIKPTRIAVADGEEGGLLVFHHEVLVAVLSCLAHPMHGDETGRWYLEAGFGPCALQQATFATLDAALRWVTACLKLDADAAVPPALAGFVPPPGCR